MHFDDTKPVIEVDHKMLTEIINVSLWAGQLLLQHGAPTQIVEETVHHIGTGLGCDWLDVVVLTNSVAITATSNHDFRTKVRRVVKIGVNMQVIYDVNNLSRHIWEGQADLVDAQKELRRISDQTRNYGRWTTTLMVGIACASFSRLFGGDIPTLLITFFASSLGMLVQQELSKRFFNGLLVVFVTAFVAGLGASLAHFFSPAPEIALASSVLLLVPGVHLINSAEDLIEGHMLSGIIRGILGAIISLVLALGLLIAIQISGVSL